MHDPPGSESMLTPPPFSDPRAHALFLDLDGTLAPIAPRPEDVTGDPGLSALLQALARAFEGRVAILSGRTVADVDRITGGPVQAVAGVHGLERRDAQGRVERIQAPAELRQAKAAFEDFASGRPGVLVEDKGLGLGLHFRNAPEAGPEAVRLATRLERELGLEHQPGSMVEELRAPGGGKDEALSRFMAEAPFAGARPVAVGDDLTDEAMFLAALRGGGYGVVVGPRAPTSATHRLSDVAAARAWLAELVSEEVKT